MSTLLTDEVRGLLGRSVSFAAPEPLGRAAIRYFAIAIGDANPLYTDAGFAHRHGHPDVIAPPTLVCETNQYMAGERNPDGYIGFTWEVPVPGRTRLVRGGNEYRFERAVLPTDVITATFTVADISERTASSGLAMLILVNEVVYTNQDGERLAANRETLIWQELK